MKLSIHLGLKEPPREMNWWRPIEDLRLVICRGKKWEFSMYKDDDTKQVDKICYFSEVNSWDPVYFATTYEDIDHYLVKGFGQECQCGAIYTSFPSIHMFYCPKWSKW